MAKIGEFIDWSKLVAGGNPGDTKAQLDWDAFIAPYLAGAHSHGEVQRAQQFYEWLKKAKEKEEEVAKDPNDPLGASDVIKDRIKELSDLNGELAKNLKALKVLGGSLQTMVLHSKNGQAALTMHDDRELADEVYQLVTKILHARVDALYKKIKETAALI